VGGDVHHLRDSHPFATFVDYHVPEDDINRARSLRVVMEKHAGRVFVVAIVHDEWTI